MNLVCHAQNFFVFRKLHLTFHLGDSQTWLKEKYIDYYVHNHAEAAKIVNKLELRHGALETIEAFEKFKLGIESAKAFLRAEEKPEVQFRKMKKRIKKLQSVA